MNPLWKLNTAYCGPVAPYGFGNYWTWCNGGQLQHGPSDIGGHHGPVTLEGDMARTIAGNTYFVFKLRIIFSVIYTKW